MSLFEEKVPRCLPGIRPSFLQIRCSAPPVDTLERQAKSHVVSQCISRHMLPSGHPGHDSLQTLNTSLGGLDTELSQLLSAASEHHIAREVCGSLFLRRFPPPSYCLVALNYCELILGRVLPRMAEFMEQINEPTRPRPRSLLEHNDVALVHAPACPVKGAGVLQR